MKKFFFIFFCIFMFNVPVFSESSIEIPDYTYKSPEAESFMRQGQYSVGEYSGKANISIPIYTIDYKDISLPINLVYNSGGVKVSSEATWVGLNWSLDVGGCINLIPAGGVDDFKAVSSWKNHKSILDLRSDYEFGLEWDSWKKGKLPESLIEDSRFGLTEVDLFQVSLPSGSFLFYINPETNKFELTGSVDQNYKIEKVNTGWEIIDGRGYSYCFECQEKTIDSNGKNYVTAWYMTRIISPLGFSLEFSYSKSSTIHLQRAVTQVNDIVLDRETLSSTIYGVTTSPHTGFESYLSSDHSYIDKAYLTHIYSDDQIVKFVLGDRKDMIGAAKKLESIIVFSKSEEPYKEKRKINFNYSYFESNTCGGSYLNNNEVGDHTSDDSRLRLKLNSVSFGEGKDKQIYSFAYKESVSFPLKTSCAQDLWGFYNGRENKFNGHYMLTPAPKYCDLNVDDYKKTINEPGANRFADMRYTDALSLEKIVYPTKGYTKFVYEPNRFMMSYTNLMSSGNNDIKNYTVTDINAPNAYGPICQQDFTIKHDSYANLEVSFNSGKDYRLSNLKSSSACVRLMWWDDKKHTYKEIAFMSLNDEGSTYDISKETFVKKTKKVEMPAGKYFILAILPDNIKYGGGASVMGSLNIFVSGSGMEESIGGGIRIKSIINYDSDNTLLEQTDYEYVNKDGSTSGKLLVVPKLYDINNHYVQYAQEKKTGSTTIVSSTETLFKMLTITNSSSNVVPFVATVNNGLDVGYSRVVKKTKTDKGTISVISKFRNELLSRNPWDYYVQCIPQNGLLLSQEICDEDGKTVKIIENKYSTASVFKKLNVSLKQEKIMYAGNWGSYDLTALSIKDRQCFEIQCYSFQKFWNQLLSSTEINYENNVPAQSVITRYQYNGLNYMVSRKEHQLIGDNLIQMDSIWYTVDALDDASKSMANMHNLNTIVQQSSYFVNDSKIREISRKKIVFQKQNDGNYLPSYEYYSVGGEKPKMRLSFKYDRQGNVAEIVKDSVERVAYLWSYFGRYPIAKIEGMTISEVKNQFASYSFVNDLVKKGQPSEDDYKTIDKLRKAGVSVTTYRYDHLKGLSSVTAPNGETISFVYDSLGRLLKTIDNKGKIMSSNVYNYIL